MRKFTTGATRDTDEGKLHYKGFISQRALRRFAEYMEKHRVQADGNLRDPDNWKKGIPLDAYEDSLYRHTMEFYGMLEDGMPRDHEKVVDAATAMMFNLQGWLHEMDKEASERQTLLAEEKEAHAWLEQALDYEDGWAVIEPVRKDPQSANPVPTRTRYIFPGPKTPEETNDALEALPEAEEPCSELVDLVGTEEVPEYEAEPDALMARHTSRDRPQWRPLSSYGPKLV